MSRTGKLIVPETVYRMRLERMKKLIELNAPQNIVAAEARLIGLCFAWSWSAWRQNLLMKTPHWLHWLLSSGYREMWRAGEE